VIRGLWIGLGALSVTLGVIGLFLPFLPTVPFLLVAAFSFSQGSERLHRWLLDHPRLGPPIRDWNERRAISRRAKYLATLSCLAALIMSAALHFSGPVIGLQALTLSAVMVSIWTRPDS